ncbi:YrbL family protein [Castellaniella sp.]|uniref:YrbL family protein n=1 Tax=Castellaniella sp. TaxID=1955812 RepID=UPI00355DC016
MLKLRELIGTGNDRMCWRHPENPAWCVKVPKATQERPQNEIDAHYARHLARRNVRGPHMPRVHDWVQTDHGPGLAFDLVQEPDGSPSPALLDAVLGGRVTPAEARELIDEAFGWLIDQRVLLVDFGIDNLLIQTRPDGRRFLVFVDGLGARKFSARYWFHRRFWLKAVWKAREFRLKTLALLDEALALRAPKG